MGYLENQVLNFWLQIDYDSQQLRLKYFTQIFIHPIRINALII